MSFVNGKFGGVFLVSYYMGVHLAPLEQTEPIARFTTNKLIYTRVLLHW